MVPTSKVLVVPSPVNTRSAVADATTLGIPDELIADIRPCTVLLGATGTKTWVLLILIGSPATSTGLDLVVEVTPYTRLWFTLRCTCPSCVRVTVANGSPTYTLQLLEQICTAVPNALSSFAVAETIFCICRNSLVSISKMSPMVRLIVLSNTMSEPTTVN